MHTNSAFVGNAYYTAMSQKDLSQLALHIHDEIQFYTPLGKVAGKEAFLRAVEGFMNTFKSLEVHSVFGKENEAAIIYEIDCPAPINQFRAVAFMNIENNLIKRLELFYDGRPFEARRQEIFGRDS